MHRRKPGAPRAERDRRRAGRSTATDPGIARIPTPGRAGRWAGGAPSTGRRGRWALGRGPDALGGCPPRSRRSRNPPLHSCLPLSVCVQSLLPAQRLQRAISARDRSRIPPKSSQIARVPNSAVRGSSRRQPRPQRAAKGRERHPEHRGHQHEDDFRIGQMRLPALPCSSWAIRDRCAEQRPGQQAAQRPLAGAHVVEPRAGPAEDPEDRQHDETGSERGKMPVITPKATGTTTTSTTFTGSGFSDMSGAVWGRPWADPPTGDGAPPGWGPTGPGAGPARARRPPPPSAGQGSSGCPRWPRP